MIQILHTGDLHLGSPFSGLPLRESALCRARQAESFRGMVEFAARESVALFLIAGDLFDSDTVTPAVLDETFDALASLPCPVVIAPGNHDPYRRGSPYASRALPENVFVFDSEALAHFSFPEIGNGVDVFGYAFCDASLSASPLTDAGDRACLGNGLSILLAHGDVDAPLSKYGPIRSSDLARCGADYVALGHVHNVPDALSFYGDSAAAYCGFPEGRSFDECGFGTFRLLTFDENAHSTHPLVASKRIRSSMHRYLWETCDVSGCTSDAEVEERIRAFLKSNEIGSETALRLTLSGEVPSRYTPDPVRLAETLTGGDAPHSIEVIDRTLPVLDASYLENDLTIRGELYRILKPKMLEGTPEERADAASALRIGLAALDGRPIL